MKRITSLLFTFMALVLISGLTGCNSDPTKEEVFMGTYKGLVAYGSIDGELEVRTNPEGSVTVTKVGNRYTFVFSDDIPKIINIKMESRNEDTDVYKGEGLTRITITNNKLNIFYNQDGKNWTARCTRETDED